MAEISGSETVSTRQQRIAELAKQAPEMAFTSLNHTIDLLWLHEAYRRTRKDGAPGVDGQTAASYEADLEGNLANLLERAKSGSYHAPPVRRVHIPKGRDQTRPIGVPTLEDKVLQRAVTMVLEPIYEQDFEDCSYGFRPARSAHQALEALWQELMQVGGGWVLEVDIRQFFDTLDHGHLREILQQRVRDGVLRRLIGKWLNAGVLEAGTLTYPESGTPQGGVVSPLLANIYLHAVLDRWFRTEVQPRLRGRTRLIRYADDFVIVFSDESDARRVMEVLPKRFGRYGLHIHPEKTRLVEFNRPGRRPPHQGGSGPGSFDLLGFTHYWDRSRKGKWVVKRKTARSRLGRSLRTMTQWCRVNRHRPLAEQHAVLRRKLKGHYAYYGITGNSKSLSRFRYAVLKIWWKWLGRRHRAGRLSWERFEAILKRYPLPRATPIHSIFCRHAANP